VVGYQKRRPIITDGKKGFFPKGGKKNTFSKTIILSILEGVNTIP